MAEYTIPKPYRDFYVTDPLIELKNSLNEYTTTPFTYLDSLTDFSDTYKTTIKKKTNGDITLIVNCKKQDDSDFEAGTPIHIGTLPAGYRPSQPIRFPIMGASSDSPISGWGIGWIDAWGGVIIRPGVNVKSIGFTIQYPSN